jgi:hypothetical protein
MAGGSLAECHDTHQHGAAWGKVSLILGQRAAARQCFWRSADTASRKARVIWVNRSIAGDPAGRAGTAMLESTRRGCDRVGRIDCRSTSALAPAFRFQSRVPPFALTCHTALE